jgi:hypothetical protein
MVLDTQHIVHQSLRCERDMLSALENTLSDGFEEVRVIVAAEWEVAVEEHEHQHTQ